LPLARPDFGQPARQHTDLTQQAVAPPTATGSQPSGYAQPAATQRTAAQAAAGPQVAGYRTLTELTKPYGWLRARLLSMHFALGRYFLADHLSIRNLLATLHQAGKHAVYLDSARHFASCSSAQTARPPQYRRAARTQRSRR